jgi:hypothetical protein
MTGHEPVLPVRGADLHEGGAAHRERQPAPGRAEGNDRRADLGSAPRLVPLDRGADRVGEGPAITPRLIGAGEQLQQRLGEPPVLDADEQDQVALAGEHPVARDRPEPVLTVVVHSCSPTGLPPVEVRNVIWLDRPLGNAVPSSLSRVIGVKVGPMADIAPG